MSCSLLALNCEILERRRIEYEQNNCKTFVCIIEMKCLCVLLQNINDRDVEKLSISKVIK